MSAYGKRCLNASNVSTPDRGNDNASNRGSSKNAPSKKDGLVLPPIDPRRARRASENVEANMLPPRPTDGRRKSVERNGSRGHLQRAGQ